MNELEDNHKINKRITIAIDEQTKQILNKLNNHSESSRSETIRKAIRFYHNFKKVFNNSGNGVSERVNTYIDLLAQGEHIILDVDHYLSFLKFIEQSPEKEEFSKINKAIGKAHAQEFSEDLDITTIQKVIERLEACNFFKIVKDSSNSFTLLLGSDIQRNFIKTFLEEVLHGMGFKIIIKEGFSKLKIILNNISF
ncbi:MAG: ribbon-helix-helix protein, CopG family [Promethearchaeota archaeon]